MRRADGYYAQFCVAINRVEEVQPTEQIIALDVGLMHFYTDNRGNKVENPRHVRKSEKAPDLLAQLRDFSNPER